MVDWPGKAIKQLCRRPVHCPGTGTCPARAAHETIHLLAKGKPRPPTGGRTGVYTRNRGMTCDGIIWYLEMHNAGALPFLSGRGPNIRARMLRLSSGQRQVTLELGCKQGFFWPA